MWDNADSNLFSNFDILEDVISWVSFMDWNDSLTFGCCDDATLEYGFGGWRDCGDDFIWNNFRGLKGPR